MCKICWSSLAALLLLGGLLGYRFIFQGDTLPLADGRVAIQLNDSERDLLLSEMRGFLATLQAITEGATGDDLALAANAARKAGIAAQKGVPVSLMSKLPLAFKQLGVDTHRQFDQLALDADQMGDADHTLGQMSRLMQNCVSCHAAYRIALADES
ncbi:MAG: hypothetical protein OQL28_02625 [Sedimenticola sp.]|nr:hypothetical protein [Sedimenticola sp.]